MRYALLAALLLLSPPLAAQTIEERLAKLEAEVRELREENRALREQLNVAKPPAPAAVQPAGKETKLTVGGLVQAQAESGGQVDARWADDNDRIFLRRARVGVQGAFAEHFDFRVQLDLAGSIAANTGLRAQATDAYVTWNRHPAAKVRIGQFKAPFGFESLFSDQHMPTPERTLGSDRLALSRQVGAQLFGDLANKRLAYAVGAFNGIGSNASANDDEGFLTAARLSGTLVDRKPVRWSLGVNGYRSDDRNAGVPPELRFGGNAFMGEREAFGFDTQLAAGPFELWFERLDVRYAPPSGGAREAVSHMLLGTWSITDRVEAVVRWDQLEATDSAWPTWLLGTNYYIKGHDLKLQLHWHIGEDDSRVIARLQTIF